MKDGRWQGDRIEEERPEKKRESKGSSLARKGVRSGKARDPVICCENRRISDRAMSITPQIADILLVGPRPHPGSLANSPPTPESLFIRGNTFDHSRSTVR